MNILKKKLTHYRQIQKRKTVFPNVFISPRQFQKVTNESSFVNLDRRIGWYKSVLVTIEDVFLDWYDNCYIRISIKASLMLTISILHKCHAEITENGLSQIQQENSQF